MEVSYEASFDGLLPADTEHAFFRRIADVGKELGFEFCSYGIKIPVPISRPTVVIFDSYPTGWMEHYRDQGYLDVDPTVRRGALSSRPIIWSDETFAPALQLWEDARAAGLQFGWAQSAREAGGTFGLLSLARSTEPLTDNELRAKQAQLNCLTEVAHIGMSNLLKPRLVPETLAVLSPRELEVLRWTADGKTAYEIGRILKISERTVNFHVNNAMSKLNATNKIQASIKALALGLLSV